MIFRLGYWGTPRFMLTADEFPGVRLTVAKYSPNEMALLELSQSFCTAESKGMAGFFSDM